MVRRDETAPQNETFQKGDGKAFVKVNVPEKALHRTEKYRNHAQLVQGVSQIDDPTLIPTDRLFLNCLAAHAVKTLPHPGNQRLMRACCVRSRQSVNKIARRLLDKKLIEIVDRGDGRGHAAVYRICVEDDRFPKPATPELPVSEDKPATLEAPVSENKPAMRKPKTRNATSLNPQLDPAKPATLEAPTDLTSGSNTGYNIGEERSNPAAPAAATLFRAFRQEVGIEPCGNLRFQKLWVETLTPYILELESRKRGRMPEAYWPPALEWQQLAEVMEECIQTCLQRHVHVPQEFYDQKHWMEKRAKFNSAPREGHGKKYGAKVTQFD